MGVPYFSNTDGDKAQPFRRVVPVPGSEALHLMTAHERAPIARLSELTLLLGAQALHVGLDLLSTHLHQDERTSIEHVLVVHVHMI